MKQYIKGIRASHFVVIGLFALTGALILGLSFAATLSSKVLEAETASSVLTKADTSASDGKFIEFGAQTPTPPPTPTPTPNPGGGKPVAGHDGTVGCKTNCETVGFQNLDGKDGVTIENKIITNPSGKCMSLNSAKNITIRNVTVKDCATQQTLSGDYHNPIIPVNNAQNITIENSLFSNLARKESTPNRNNLFNLINVSNFVFRNNEVRDLHSNINSAGAVGGGGAADHGNRLFYISGSNSNVKIEYNSMFNPGRNIVQIARSGSFPGFLFANNRVEGRGEWDSDFEDMLNFYQVSGTASSPITVRGNYFRNGGPSINGTTMALGDGGGEQSSHILVENNVMLNSGKVGIAISGGTNFIVRNNITLGDVDVPISLHSKLAEAVGMHLMDLKYTPFCGNHTISGNRIYYKNQAAGGYNNFYNDGKCMSGVTLQPNLSAGDPTLKRADIWPFN